MRYTGLPASDGKYTKVAVTTKLNYTDKGRRRGPELLL